VFSLVVFLDFLLLLHQRFLPLRLVRNVFTEVHLFRRGFCGESVLLRLGIFSVRLSIQVRPGKLFETGTFGEGRLEGAIVGICRFRLILLRLDVNFADVFHFVEIVFLHFFLNLFFFFEIAHKIDFWIFFVVIVL